jgi:mannose-6-phosphate isomerase-like protein (cupin superfamily)
MNDVSQRRSPVHRRSKGGGRWEGVDRLPYKEDEQARFKAISRQVLFSDSALAAELRFFEVTSGGFSSLERHQHAHAVLVLHGRGQCLIGREVRHLEPHDLVTVPPWTWHQFRAATDEPLGFLCMVNVERDRPQLPSDEDLADLQADPSIAAFLQGLAPDGVDRVEETKAKETQR